VASVVGSELYSEIAEIINDNLTDLGISIDAKKTKNKNIYIQCEDDRVETQDHLESLLDNLQGVTSQRISGTSKSSMDFTRIKRGSTEVDLVYKGGAKGGMNVTTLNASITELFPAVAFELGLPKNISKDNFWQKIYSEGVKLKTGGVYKNDTALKAGKEVIMTAKEKSDMFDAKLGNAYDLFKYVMSNYERKKIDKIVWGYRNNTKPTGVKPNHKGDIFLVYNDGNMIGLSIKATSSGPAPPQFNSYVRAIFNAKAFSKLGEFEKLKKVSYDTYYKNILGIPPFKDYGNPKMTAAVGSFEKRDTTEYNKVYDEQLKWLKGVVIDLIKNNPEDAKEWILKEVVAEQEDVPLVVLHAKGGGKVEPINDEEEVKVCVKVSKKGKGGITAYPAAVSAKQDFIVALTCNDSTTKLKFSIRTNKSGIHHKLGQYVNLAVKFNGIV
jgi:hypothetical protein